MQLKPNPADKHHAVRTLQRNMTMTDMRPCIADSFAEETDINQPEKLKIFTLQPLEQIVTDDSKYLHTLKTIRNRSRDQRYCFQKSTVSVADLRSILTPDVPFDFERYLKRKPGDFTQRQM
jgi:hypothetical protein